MAAGDAVPVPRRNVAYRVTFPIIDADGDLVTGATGLDSEVSKDAGTFADCTNEATEIATSSGVYYLDLVASETDADTVAIIVKTSSVGAKTTVIVLYPESAGDIRCDTVQISGDTTAADNAELFFDGTGYAGGTTKLQVDAVAISGDTTAADNLEAAYDGTGYTDGTAQAGTASSITLAAGASSTDNYYQWSIIQPIGGTGGGQTARLITGYTGSSRVATIFPNWTTNPDSTTTYIIQSWGAIGRLYTEAVDDILKRDMSAVSGEASRSPLNALRTLRNRWTLSGSTLTVYKEDGTTTAYTSSVTTDGAANPITGHTPS